MIQTRTKVDALKDLGEKVTGATLPSEENETIVGMIDQIAEAYTGGGSSSSPLITIHISEGDVSSNPTEIDNESDIEQLEKFYNGLVGGANVSLVGVMLDNSNAEENTYGGIYYIVEDIYASNYEGEEEAQINIVSVAGNYTNKKHFHIDRDENGTWTIRG